MVNPKCVELAGTRITCSTNILAESGPISANDVAALASGEVGRVIRFWSFGDNIVAEMFIYTDVGGSRWKVTTDNFTVIDIDTIVDVVTYGPSADDCIRVLLPVRVKYSLL